MPPFHPSSHSQRPSTQAPRPLQLSEQVGDVVGFCVGLSEGAAVVGDSVGDVEGAAVVGDSVGDADGCTVGLALVGDSVGAAVGRFVGNLVGEFDG